MSDSIHEKFSTVDLGLPEMPFQSSRSHLIRTLYETNAQLVAHFERESLELHAVGADGSSDAGVATGPSAGDLKRVLQLRANRRQRDTGPFLDWPAWDMVLDLAAVRAEGRHISVSAVCVSSGAPQSTALRKLAQLEAAKLIRRYQHGHDRRRVSVALTDQGVRFVSETVAEDLQFYRQNFRR